MPEPLSARSHIDARPGSGDRSGHYRISEGVAPLPPGGVVDPDVRVSQEFQDQEFVRRTNTALSVRHDLLIPGHPVRIEQRL